MKKAKMTNQDILNDAGVSHMSDIDEHKLLEKWTLRRISKFVSNKKLLPEQREELQKFVNECLNKNTKIRSICSNLTAIHNFALKVKKPFLEVKKADVTAYLSGLRLTGSYSPRTLAVKNIYMRYFFKWLYKDHGIKYETNYPEVVDHLSPRAHQKELLPSENF